MVARITKGKDVQGALRYNMNKVDQGHARILFGHKIFESPNADLPDMESCMESFRLYLEANKSTKDTAFHVSLNPDPKDNLTNAQLSSIAQEYMAKMGFGEQPYIIYTHEDIFRKHVHIVSVRVDENGKAISDSNER